MNTFQTIEISYKTHPNLSLITAIHMSCALPGLFMPVITDNECYIDGGFIDNYPLHFCLKSTQSEIKEEILGLNYTISSNNEIKQHPITKESTILDFILEFAVKSMNHIANSVTSPSIPYEVLCNFEESPISFQATSNTIKSKELRKKMYEDGFKYAKQFLENLKT
jgi:predicted acylesterase/phospholipase RssA